MASEQYYKNRSAGFNFCRSYLLYSIEFSMEHHVGKSEVYALAVIPESFLDLNSEYFIIGNNFSGRR